MPPTSDAEQVIHAFRRKRRLQWCWYLPAAGLAVWIYLRSDSISITGPDIPIELAVLGVFMFAWLMFSFWNWRCPACKAYLGESFHPATCLKCGALLR